MGWIRVQRRIFEWFLIFLAAILIFCVHTKLLKLLRLALNGFGFSRLKSCRNDQKNFIYVKKNMVKRHFSRTMRLIYWLLRSTATFVICFHRSLLLAFSLHFSSSSAFLRSLFTQSSHLSCDLPRFLQHSCFFVSALFGSLSFFIRTMCPAHFIRLLTILPTIHALVPTSSRRAFIDFIPLGRIPLSRVPLRRIL